MAKLLPNLERYHKPETIDEAVRILRETDTDVMVLAGGVSFGMAPRRNMVEVVSVEKLRLDYLIEQNGGLHIGAAKTLGSLERELESHNGAVAGLVQQATSRTAVTPLRNLMTIGGVVAGVGPWSDLPVALLVLDTHIVINGKESIRLEELFEAGSKRMLTKGKLITEMRIGTGVTIKGAAFSKVGRNVTDLAMASAAVSLQDAVDGSTSVAAAVGGLVSRPKRLRSVENYLTQIQTGKADRDELFRIVSQSVKPRSDPRADTEYRLNLAAHLIADCFERAHMEEGR